MPVDGYGSSLCTTAPTRWVLCRTKIWPRRRRRRWPSLPPRASTWSLWTMSLASKTCSEVLSSYPRSNQPLTGHTAPQAMPFLVCALREMLDPSLTPSSLLAFTWLFQVVCRQQRPFQRPFAVTATRILPRRGTTKRHQKAILVSFWSCPVH